MTTADPETGLPRVLVEVRVSKGTSLDPGLMQLILYGRQLMSPLPHHAAGRRVRNLALVSLVWNADADVLLSGLWESRCDTPDGEFEARRAALAEEEAAGRGVRARDVIFGEGVEVRMSDRVAGLDNALPTRASLGAAQLRFRQW